MSKLDRKNHKVFGINATETKVGQFGSANATTKITTKDVEKIQALDAWEQGWEAGAVGNNRYPTQQERTGVDYEHSYQIGYMLQEGVPEWNKDTTYNKGSIVKAYNGTTLQNYVSLVDDNLNNAVTDTAKWKSGLANSDLSNLTTTGEKHFLNKSQITNCLLEVPQRIKYTLVDSTLTIKAGSVVIVPYGTEDKTADLPKGATFINENFKVYDTQYSDGKFFVWAELVNDVSDSYTVSDTATRILSIATKTNEIAGSINSVSSATPSASQYTIVYNLSTNFIGYTHENSTLYYSEHVPCLPFMLALSDGKTPYGSIQQVFNGMGYIGSTVWVDKGVKGLCPNGRNADGSLINEEVVTDKFYIDTFDTNSDSFHFETAYELADGTSIIPENHVVLDNSVIVYEQSIMPTSTVFKWIDTANNQILFKNEAATIECLRKPYKIKNMFLAEGLISNGKITSFAPKLPFRAADENDIDGNWVRQSLHIINGETAFPLGSQQYRDYDISSYLPNDGHIYELAVEILAFSGSATNATSHWWISDNIGTYQTCSCGGRAYSGTRDQQYANGIIPMAGRTLRLYCSSTQAAPTISVLRLCGYRKVR